MSLGLAWAGYFLLPESVRRRVGSGLTERCPWLESALDA